VVFVFVFVLMSNLETRKGSVEMELWCDVVGGCTCQIFTEGATIDGREDGSLKARQRVN
jgi:hypothetical protein